MPFTPIKKKIIKLCQNRPEKFVVLSSAASSGRGLARTFWSAVLKRASGGRRSLIKARKMGIDAAMMVMALSAAPHDTSATVSAV